MELFWISLACLIFTVVAGMVLAGLAALAALVIDVVEVVRKEKR